MTNQKKMSMPIHCPQHLVVSYASDEQCSFCEIERLRAALTRYGKHDSGGMSDQPGCQKTRMGGGPCTCGLDEALT